MRALAVTLLLYGLLAGPSAMAGDDHTKGTSDTTAPTATKDAKTPANGAQPTTASKDSPTTATPALETEIEQLRELMQAQQAAMKTQQEEIEALKEQLTGSHNAAVAPTVPSGLAATANSNGTGTAAVAGNQGQNSGPESDKDQNAPLSFKIGAANFTPGGFMDFTSYTRTTNVGSGIGTSFNTIPFNNDASGKGGQTESRFSAQNSRISLKADAPVGGGHVTGYVEADFLGNAPTNLDVTSNGNTFRMRVYFADYTHGKWEMLAGQDWSMLTPNRKGIGVMPSDVFYSQDMDTNYQVGLTWARQAQFRLLYHPTDSWTAGISLENPDQYTGSAVTFPACFNGTVKPCTSQTNQVDQGTTTSSPTVFPDIIAKIARDQKVGENNWHFEVAGVASQIKLFTPTSASGGPGSSQSKTAGGLEANMNLEVVKNFHLIANSFWSDGEGRYIFGLGPSFTVAQDPASLNFYPSLVHSGSGIGGFEWQGTKKSMLYGYYGAAYYGRDVSFDPLAAGNPPVGYGFTGSSSSNNRALQEGTLGVIQTFWKNPNYGALQLITQASYVTRAAWYVAPGQPKNAHTTMFYADIRYVLP